MLAHIYILKIAKKLKKLKKQHYGIILSQNKLENAEKEKR